MINDMKIKLKHLVMITQMRNKMKEEQVTKGAANLS